MKLGTVTTTGVIMDTAMAVTMDTTTAIDVGGFR